MSDPVSTPTESISQFRGKYRFLSNFWLAPIIYKGVEYESAEHGYQSQKTIDPAEQKRVNFHVTTTKFEGKEHRHSRATTPGESKAAGRLVTMRPDWDQIKFDVMLDIVRVKFTNPVLCQQLLDTEDLPLIEGNFHHDTTFGVCLCPKHGYGDNRLGRILMQVRAEIQLTRT